MGKGKLLYGGIRTLYFGIRRATKRHKKHKRHKNDRHGAGLLFYYCFLVPFVLFVPFCGLRRRVELLRHAHEVGEGVGVHFFHDLAAMEFDGDFACA